MGAAVQTLGPLDWGDLAARAVSRRFYGMAATRAALAAVTNAPDGAVAMVADGSSWRWDASLATTADGEILLGAATAGRWVRADPSFVMKIAISFANTDGQAIWTCPAGFVAQLTARPWWEVTANWTGGSSSAIGLSTNITGYTTKGDLLGGATGDVAATLTAANGIAGTIGAELDDAAGMFAMRFVEDSEIQFDRITSAFDAGTGFACVPVTVMPLAA